MKPSKVLSIHVVHKSRIIGIFCSISLWNVLEGMQNSINSSRDSVIVSCGLVIIRSEDIGNNKAG